jgi:hypothetical protein
MIYKTNCPQDLTTEKSILRGTHPLSKDIETNIFVVTDENYTPICRCLMTYYKNDSVAYVGFFESQYNIDAVKLMFEKVELRATRDHKTSLCGPIDASIYIKYRFKIDNFENVYTGEPYNKDYYQELWSEIGFTVSNKYMSHQMRRVKENDFDHQLDRIYNRFLEKGYYFCCPNKNNFERSLEDIYTLLIDRYSNFPGYKHISKEQFIALYSKMKHIANYDMIKLVYKDETLKAFGIALPNYKGLTNGSLNLRKLVEIARIKKQPSEYVILYVGADNQTPGIGAALMQVIRNELFENQCTSIGALIREGNVTNKFYSILHTTQYNYVLMRKEI